MDLDLAEPMTRDVAAALIGLLHRHQVVVVPGQSLEPEAFIRFGACFGRPHHIFLDHLLLPGHPEIFVISNDEARGRDERTRNGAAYWHTDMSYEAEPSSATMLYSIEAPEVGGETLICDMFAAYDALPAAMRARLESLTVVHRYGNRDADAETEKIEPEASEAQLERVPEVRHPLVRPHPVTGRKALYAVSGSSRGIVGMPDDEALGLLAEVKAHCIQPQFVYAHKYAVGDVIVWDTASTMHSATPIGPKTGPRDGRLLHRISVKGRPPVLG
jgi:taurine dioxygenase